MNDYTPMRILKDIQVPVRTKVQAELYYPHGEVNSVQIKNATVRAPGYTVIYRAPMRINVPSEKELAFVKAGYAKLIPQDPRGVDDPTSEVSGSASKAEEHQRKARKYIKKRVKREPVLRELEELEAEKESESAPASDIPSELPDKKSIKEKSDV